MSWIYWNILGATALAICNSFFKANPYNWPVIILLISMIPLTTLGTQLGFLLAYKSGPSFYQCWFAGSAFSAIAGYLAAVLVFHEQLHILHGLGIALILGGTWLLIR